VAALGRPDLAGRTLPIGRQLTGDELASAIGAALGRPVRHAPMTPRQLGEAVRPMMGDQAAEILAADYGLLAERADALGLAADREAAHREIGVPLTPLAEWARAQDWRGAAAMAAAAA
jgi:hypothetical protein